MAPSWKSAWRHNFIAVRPINTKYGWQMQIWHADKHRSHGSQKWNSNMAAVPSETRSSYISTIDWSIWWNSGIERDVLLLKEISLIEIAQNMVEKNAKINVNKLSCCKQTCDYCVCQYWKNITGIWYSADIVVCRQTLWRRRPVKLSNSPK